jgi:hypothetical protein
MTSFWSKDLKQINLNKDQVYLKGNYDGQLAIQNPSPWSSFNIKEDWRPSLIIEKYIVVKLSHYVSKSFIVHCSLWAFSWIMSDTSAKTV